jgi:hypothetical protein
VADVDDVGWLTVTVIAAALKPPAAGSPPAEASGTVTAWWPAIRPLDRYAVNAVTEWYVEGAPVLIEAVGVGT